VVDGRVDGMLGGELHHNTVGSQWILQNAEAMCCCCASSCLYALAGAVSRAFGDARLKKRGVISTPDIARFPLTGLESFLLLGCDGLWNVFTADDAVNFVHNQLKVSSIYSRCALKSSRLKSPGAEQDLHERSLEYGATKYASTREHCEVRADWACNPTITTSF